MRVSTIKLLESCQAHCRGSINVSYCCETFRPFYLCDIASSFLLPFEVAVTIKFILQMRKQALSESCSRSLCKQPAEDLNSGFFNFKFQGLADSSHTLSFLDSPNLFQPLIQKNPRRTQIQKTARTQFWIVCA